MGIMAARTYMQCNLLLARRMGNLCSSGVVDAEESCSCSHCDGTYSFWIFAVGKEYREV